MGKIKKLDQIIANKIAAGEVIEKLGNVVKELVENSIDANANKIDIELKDSGLKLIKVTDNGTGMDESDAMLSFERHATSKIETVKDLFSISSLGFRGEALSSIASIAKVELLTSAEEEGIKIVYENGKLIDKKKASANRGTQVKVSKLFYSTPARFKYLKSSHYELAIIVGMVHKFALSFPGISFRLLNDGKLLFVSNGNNSVLDIMANIYGTEVARSLLTFLGQNRDYKVSGYTSNPLVNRSSRNYMNVIVNKRVISDSKITRTIKECYEQLIPISRYPITVLYIEVDPSLIDVNIHPRKQEIKFSEYNSLLDLIKESIEAKIRPQKIYQKPDNEILQTKLVFHEEERFSVNEELEENNYLGEPKQPNKDRQNPIQKILPEGKPETVIPDMDYIGQYTGTYLIFQNEDAMYLIDQHAAAERIRYEKYAILMKNKNLENQDLLVPMELDLPMDVLIQAKPYLEQLNEFGLEIELFHNHAQINRIPSWFPTGFELVYTEAAIMNFVEEKTTTKEKLIDDLAKLLACKHSLKANHYITEREAQSLLKDLRKCNRPYTCPHGRPIIVTISNNQVERWFNRVI